MLSVQAHGSARDQHPAFIILGAIGSDILVPQGPESVIDQVAKAAVCTLMYSVDHHQ